MTPHEIEIAGAFLGLGLVLGIVLMLETFRAAEEKDDDG